MKILAFTCYGKPETKGSARAYTVRKPGGKIGVRITNDNPKTKGWQDVVAGAAVLAARAPGSAPLERYPQELPMFPVGQVSLECQLFLPRPQALMTRKKIGTNPPHVVKPDLDKLLRAVKDALTGVAWSDDAQVTRIFASKHYAAAIDKPRVTIRVWKDQA
jgi:hypothetical protein